MAKKKLLGHFERDPLEMVEEELVGLTLFGNCSAESFLMYMCSLPPADPEITISHLWLLTTKIWTPWTVDGAQVHFLIPVSEHS